MVLLSYISQKIIDKMMVRSRMQILTEGSTNNDCSEVSESFRNDAEWPWDVKRHLKLSRLMAKI